MKRILVVEPDGQFATQLFQALLDAGEYNVSLASSMREACLVVAQQEQDLAFVPHDQDERLLRSLRSLQPDLPMIVTVPYADVQLPDGLHRMVQGQLVRGGPGDRVAQVLHDALETPLLPVRPEEAPAGAPTATMTATLQRGALNEHVLSVLLTRSEQLEAHVGALNREQVAQVVRTVVGGWSPEQSAQIQFVRLVERRSELLVYSRPVTGRYLLTLVAQPDATVGQLRRQAEAIAADVALQVASREALVRQQQAAPERPMRLRRPGAEERESRSFAIVWRPRRRLPEAMQLPLRRALRRTAEANACLLDYLMLDADLVHIVVTCPPGRNSSWAAHLFKDGAEKEIQEQFGVEARLWDKGFLAAESKHQLSQAELNLFLGRELPRAEDGLERA